MKIRIDQLLLRQGRTFYWLAKTTGISHTTLWRLKKGKALGINFDTLEKLCSTLECHPGDVLSLDPQKRTTKKKIVRAGISKPRKSSSGQSAAG